jgi:hypothetical protein
MSMALSVARTMLVVCAIIWAAALAVALLGGPMLPAYMVAQVAIVGIALSALTSLILQAIRFFRLRKERSRHA